MCHIVMTFFFAVLWWCADKLLDAGGSSLFYTECTLCKKASIWKHYYKSWTTCTVHGTIKVRARSHCAFLSDCDCDSSYRNKWVVQDSMEVFTPCDCDNITNSYVTIFSKNKSQSQSEKNVQCQWALNLQIQFNKHKLDNTIVLDSRRAVE